MNESPLPIEPESAPAPVAETSLWARLFNVFVSPGEVFEEVKAGPPRAANWLVPLLLAIVVGWIGGWLVMSDPVVQQQILDLQETALQKQAQKSGASAEQLDQQRVAAEKVSRIVREFGVWVGPVVANLVILFWWAFLTWLLGTKALPGNFGFGKALEASGLILMPGILHGVVVTLLILVMGTMFAGTNLALPLARGFDQGNPLHVMLSAVDVVALWILAIRAIALSRLSGATLTRGAAWVFGLWLIWKVITIGLSLVWMRFAG